LYVKYLIVACSLVLLAGRVKAGDAVPPGLVEGHLKIVSLKEVELAGANPSKGTSENYAEYPLIILSKAGQKEVARITADSGGNYRVSLPPGEYILDVPGRRPGGTRATPQRFTVVSNRTVRIDMHIDTGIR
jgi:hypothetical protein